MKLYTAPSIILLLGAFSAPAFAGPETATSFVQATILSRDTAKATLTFFDASGRQRTERVAADAAARLSDLRPGQEAILSISDDAGQRVVTKIRLARRADPTPPADVASAEPAPPGTTIVPAASAGTTLRRRWPNPYTKARPQPDRP
jgi:hypothetical protein